MIDPKILKRIKKCLALASSANEHEAAAALAKAAAMMEEHGISREAIDLADVEMQKTRRATAAARPPVWEANLILLVAGTFAVEPVICGKDVGFAGVGARPAIAIYAFTMVRRILARRRADYIRLTLKRCKLATKRVRADHFCQGFVRGIELEIICLVPERQECALAQAWVAQTQGVVTVSPRRPNATRSRATSDDYWNGLDEGGKVKLHQGLKGAGVGAPLGLTES